MGLAGAEGRCIHHQVVVAEGVIFREFQSARELTPGPPSEPRRRLLV
jgi:hypothetical protein